MRKSDMIAAIEAARRFVELAEKCLPLYQESEHWLFGCRRTGDARRASMDLTRALADLRGKNRAPAK
jgi:hypothetical protein